MVNLKSGVKKRVLFDKNGVPQFSLFDVKLENGGENRGQRRSWKERSNQSLAKDHERGETQDVRVDPEQRASYTVHAPEVDPRSQTGWRPWQPRSSTSYSRRMESSFEMESSTCAFQLAPIRRKVAKIRDPQKICPSFQTFSKELRLLNLCNIVFIWHPQVRHTAMPTW